MSRESADPPVDPADDCPLPPAVQWRNIWLYAGFWSLFYLAAPVTYIGSTHANLLHKLGHADDVANLPGAMYQWLTVVPIFIVWAFPRPRHLRALALLSTASMAVMSGVVAVALWTASVRLSTAATILHGAVFGIANGIMFAALWDILRRSVSTSRRGKALGLTFGVGPLFACLGSLIQDALFKGGMLKGLSLGLDFPNNFLAMFAGVVPVLFLAAALAALFVIPVSEVASEVSKLEEIKGGIKQFVGNRAVFMAVVAYILVACGGNAILSNVSLYASEKLGGSDASAKAEEAGPAEESSDSTERPTEKKAGADTLGLQSLLRFGFKAITGIFLGWLLTKTNPRATLLATSLILLLGMVWALTSSGWWLMVTFGLLGAGELYGAYFPNYVATASTKPMVRANITYLTLLSFLIGFASLGFGLISKSYGRVASFYAATVILIVAIVFVLLTLPADPTPRESEGG